MKFPTNIFLLLLNLQETDYTFIAWILLGLFALLVLMSLCLLWCCIPLITGVSGCCLLLLMMLIVVVVVVILYKKDVGIRLMQN